MVASRFESGSAAGGTCEVLALPLAAILQQVKDVLTSLSGHEYQQRMGATFANASIGGHVRHCLDHARAVVDGRRRGAIDYDHRARGTMIESDIAAAIAEVEGLIREMYELKSVEADQPIGVAVMPTRDGGSVVLSSTIGRELAFVLSHTIHHNATIRGMVVVNGRETPESFGYAPSTLAHQDRCACAQ